jgi:hypothetical protein
MLQVSIRKSTAVASPRSVFHKVFRARAVDMVALPQSTIKLYEIAHILCWQQLSWRRQFCWSQAKQFCRMMSDKSPIKKNEGSLWWLYGSMRGSPTRYGNIGLLSNRTGSAVYLLK